MPLGTRNWGGTEYHDSIFDPESQPQEYEQPYVKWLEPNIVIDSETYFNINIY